MDSSVIETESWDSPRFCEGDDGRTHLVVLQPSSFCNIDCKYCYVPNRDNRSVVTETILDEILQKILSSQRLADDFRLVWHNGEPLALGIDFYRRAIDKVDKFNVHGKRCRHRIQTNGTLINQEWVEFFVEYGISPCISMDGPQHIHDANRITRSKRGTFSQAIRGAQLIKDAGLPLVALCVVTADSLKYGSDIMNFFIDNDFESVGFIMEEPRGGNPSTSIDQCGKSWQSQFSNFYRDVLTQWYPYRNQISVREFDDMFSAFRRIKLNQSAFTQQEDNIAGRVVSFDREGNFTTFSPQMIAGTMDSPAEFIVANISDLSSLDDIDNLSRHRQIAGQVSLGVQKCKDSCGYFSVCGGGTPAGKFYETGSFNVSETRQCIGSRQILANTMLACLQDISDENIPARERVSANNRRRDTAKSYIAEKAVSKFSNAHSRRVGNKIFIWNVPTLWELAQSLVPFTIDVDLISEVDRDCWFTFDREPSIRAVSSHVKRIADADLNYPIILNADGTLMDGGHRLAKALMLGEKTIKAVQFSRMPKPDAIESL